MVPATLSESDIFAVSIQALNGSNFSSEPGFIATQHRTQNQMVPVKNSEVPGMLSGPGGSNTAQRTSGSDPSVKMVLCIFALMTRQNTLTTKTR